MSLLLVIHTALLAISAVLDSPTIDEPNHLAGGLRRLQDGKSDVNPGNPPLVGAVAAIPVVFANPHTDWRDTSGPYAQLTLFLRINGERAAWLISLGRWACIPFSLIAGYVCFRWADALFGFRAGVLALTLWCFCPSTLAHGHLLTGDMAASAIGIAAFYALWRWLQERSLPRAVTAGLALGLAEITKYVWVLLFVLWPGIWIVWRLLERLEGPKTRWRRDFVHIAFIAALCLYVINVAYLFEDCLQPVSSVKIGQRVLGWLDSAGVSTGWLASLPLPLPQGYLRGISDIDELCSRESWGYFAGKWREGGAWWFYPYAFLVKLPLGTLAILAAAGAATFSRRFTEMKNEMLLLLPIVALVAFVTLSGAPQTLRYALPVLPFACVWASKAAAAWWRVRQLTLVGIVALVGSVASSLFCYPHSLSYFNELAGGPRHGDEHLLHADLDWGQDLFFLRKWLSVHPEATPIHLAYYGFTSPQDAGIEAVRVPMATDSDGPTPGWYAISAFYVHGFSFAHRPGQGSDYEYFLGIKPVATAGYSMRIYHLTADEANHLRQELGLPPVKERGHDNGPSPGVP